MPPKSTKTKGNKTSKNCKISKSAAKSTKIKIQKLNQLDMTDIIQSASSLKQLAKGSVLDSRNLKEDKVKDDHTKGEGKKRSEEANNELMKQLDLIGL